MNERLLDAVLVAPFVLTMVETPGVEIRIKHKARDPMHLKTYQIDGKLLRTGAANFSASGAPGQRFNRD
jgi:phosphatidylserine/phosphatidylglycerophosphate/cardiolipin synthase-like enzyme